MSTFASFRENDIRLLETGYFADSTVKCNGRTWKVHRILLASRLRFFKAAFYGKFSEAESREIDFPESDPDLVDIMIRHLYGADIDVRDLKTPALCIQCWRLAGYMQLKSLKAVAISSLTEHLDAMALLATSNYRDDLSRDTPKWLTHFLDALREVCRDNATEPLHAVFATFLWVTRFDILIDGCTLNCLAQCHRVNSMLMMLLVFKDLGGDEEDDNEWPVWIGTKSWRQEIANKSPVYYYPSDRCDECDRSFGEKGLGFYNPFPVDDHCIGRLKWCKRCVDKINEGRCWPWRSGRLEENTVKLEAWTWSDGE